MDATVVDYLAVPSPRTSNAESVLRTCLLGHGHQLDPTRQKCGNDAAMRAKWVEGVKAECAPIPIEDVAYIDWWCGKISEDGRQLRSDLEKGGWGHGESYSVTGKG